MGDNPPSSYSSIEISREELRRSTSQPRLDGRDKPFIRICLRGIPHHNTAKAIEALAVVGDLLEFVRIHVSAACATRVRGRPDDDLCVRVFGRLLRPLIPRVEVEVLLLVGVGLERVQAAEIIVELDTRLIFIYFLMVRVSWRLGVPEYMKFRGG